MDDLIDRMSDWPPEHWNAIGSVGTLVIAAIAAGFAWRQIKQARGLREEEARPYVVVYSEPDKTSNFFMELIVKNIGQTVARDVTVTFEPPLERAVQEQRLGLEEAYFLQQGIPTLPPGMEYRMLFDSGPERLARDDLPRRYVANVTFSGRERRRFSRRAKPITEPYVLDLNTFYGYNKLNTKSEHHVALALEEIATTVNQWTANLNGIRVYGQDELEYNRRQRERYERLKAERDAQTRAAEMESTTADDEATDEES